MSVVRPDFPEVIDSSLIASWRSCQVKAFYEYLHHYKPKDLSVHLHAGGAFAHGLEAARRGFYEQELTPESAVELGVHALLSAYGDFQCPEDSAKSATRTAGALVYYFDRWPLGSDAAVPITLPSGRRGIEFSFSEPLDIAHPVTGNPLLYVGRCDMVTDYAGGVFAEDDKTTSQLGASWARQWELRSQFTGYCWGLRRAGIQAAGVLVRGVSILKTKYDAAEAVTYRPEWQVDRWFRQLNRDIAVMVEAWERGLFDYNLDHACNEYGGCTFKQVCLSKEPMTWLKSYYARRRWDPVTRLETQLPDYEDGVSIF